MKGEKNNHKKIIIIFVVLIIIISGVSAYFIFGHSTRRNFRGENFPNEENGGRNFQSLNESTKNEITSFFESSPSSSEVEYYCDKNKEYCFYYCADMNEDNEFCEELMNNTQMFQKGEPLQ